jgi:hypothetical protein
LVLASLRAPKPIAELCREHDISESLLRKWREQLLAAGAERLSGKLSGPKPMSGRPAAVVACDQPPGALPAPETPTGRPTSPPGRRRPRRVAGRASPTDGTRMVAAPAGCELHAPVNRKRVQRLMREHARLE